MADAGGKLTSWSALLDSLRADERTGASGLAERAAGGLVDLGRAGLSQPALRQALRALVTVRPPFAPLVHLAGRAAAASGDRSAGLGAVGQRFATELAEQHGAVVGAALPLLAERRPILTISASSVVRDVLMLAQKSGLGPEVTCLESYPGGEGVMLAETLARAGLAVRLAPDSAVARLTEEAGLILVGGDTLSPAGLIHKLGSAGLALAARASGVPSYALLGSLKLLPGAVRGWAEDGARIVDNSGPARWRRLFDRTPLELLSGVVTERGRLEPANAASQAGVTPVHPWLTDLLEG